MKIALFLAGALVGNISGIVMMCLVQINRVSEERLMKEATDYEKAKHQKTDLGE